MRKENRDIRKNLSRKNNANKYRSRKVKYMV